MFGVSAYYKIAVGCTRNLNLSGGGTVCSVDALLVDAAQLLEQQRLNKRDPDGVRAAHGAHVAVSHTPRTPLVPLRFRSTFVSPSLSIFSNVLKPVLSLRIDRWKWIELVEI